MSFWDSVREDWFVRDDADDSSRSINARSKLSNHALELMNTQEPERVTLTQFAGAHINSSRSITQQTTHRHRDNDDDRRRSYSGSLSGESRSILNAPSFRDSMSNLSGASTPGIPNSNLRDYVPPKPKELPSLEYGETRRAVPRTLDLELAPKPHPEDMESKPNPKQLDAASETHSAPKELSLLPQHRPVRSVSEMSPFDRFLHNLKIESMALDLLDLALRLPRTNGRSLDKNSSKYYGYDPKYSTKPFKAAKEIDSNYYKEKGINE